MLSQDFYYFILLWAFIAAILLMFLIYKGVFNKWTILSKCAIFIYLLFVIYKYCDKRNAGLKTYGALLYFIYLCTYYGVYLFIYYFYGATIDKQQFVI